MIIQYLFRDYKNPQQNYVIEVLKQREKPANEGYFPDEYEGDLDFALPEKIKKKIPVNSVEMFERVKGQNLSELQM